MIIKNSSYTTTSIKIVYNSLLEINLEIKNNSLKAINIHCTNDQIPVIDKQETEYNASNFTDQGGNLPQQVQVVSLYHRTTQDLILG